MTSHHYNRYLRFGAEELVLQSGGSLCPQPGCGAGILPHPDTSTTCSRLTCGECGYVFCRDCGQGAHLGPCLPCGEEEDGGGGPGPGADPSSVSSMSAMASRSRWTVADPSSVTIRVISKPCPGCRLVTKNIFMYWVSFKNKWGHLISISLAQIKTKLKITLAHCTVTLGIYLLIPTFNNNL